MKRIRQAGVEGSLTAIPEILAIDIEQFRLPQLVLVISSVNGTVEIVENQERERISHASQG